MDEVEGQSLRPKAKDLNSPNEDKVVESKGKTQKSSMSMEKDLKSLEEDKVVE